MSTEWGHIAVRHILIALVELLTWAHMALALRSCGPQCGLALIFPLWCRTRRVLSAAFLPVFLWPYAYEYATLCPVKTIIDDKETLRKIILIGLAVETPDLLHHWTSETKA